LEFRRAGVKKKSRSWPLLPLAFQRLAVSLVNFVSFVIFEHSTFRGTACILWDLPSDFIPMWRLHDDVPKAIETSSAKLARFTFLIVLIGPFDF